ncbi:hypothetical protein, partial [Endozoicomonas sp. ONNA2]|uniref:hypothetical protein n=1 Tax=Endozoicomonas sp. ONNA2 TaxID=2828741 RepID=UPI002147D6E0
YDFIWLTTYARFTVFGAIACQCFLRSYQKYHGTKLFSGGIGISLNHKITHLQFTTLVQCLAFFCDF